MKRNGRNLTDSVDGFLLGKRYLVRDRDPSFLHSDLVGRISIGILELVRQKKFELFPSLAFRF